MNPDHFGSRMRHSRGSHRICRRIRAASPTSMTAARHRPGPEIRRPIAFLLTGGQVADCTARSALLKQMPAAHILHGDKGYDSKAIRRQVEENGAMPNIPPKANRRWKNCFSPVLYRNRNAIERMFCGLKNVRRVTTPYDRCAHNFFRGIGIAATVIFWP